jgi:hypothetical protein
MFDKKPRLFSTGLFTMRSADAFRTLDKNILAR